MLSGGLCYELDFYMGLLVTYNFDRVTLIKANGYIPGVKQRNPKQAKALNYKERK